MDNTSLLSARRTGSFQILRSVWTSDYVDPQSFLGIWTSDSGINYTHPDMQMRQDAQLKYTQADMVRSCRRARTW